MTKSLAAYLIVMLLTSSAIAGPYAGMTLSVDNDRGFCTKKDFDDYCQSAAAFVGYDGRFEDGWGYDVSVAHERQLDGSGFLNPTRGAVTVYKRW